MPEVAALPEDHLGPVGSAVVGYGLCVVLPLVFFILLVVAWLRERHRAGRAQASFSGTAQLAAGETVLLGKVEYAVGADSAVRVEVTQDGTEHKTEHGWKHSWTEESREVQAQPFYLRFGKDQRVRVEPPEATMLIDDMDEIVEINQYARKRAAALTTGEEIYAHGELILAADPETQGGYRAGGQSWVLRGTSKGKMLLSTEPLGARFARQARLFRIGAIIAFIALVIAQALTIDYHMLLWRGETVTGEIVSQRHYTTKGSKGAVYDHWEVKAKLGDGHELKDEVDHRVYQRMKPGTTIAVRRVPGSTVWLRVGPTASLPTFALVLAIIGAVVLSIGLLLIILTNKPWYDKKVIDSGSGALPTS